MESTHDFKAMVDCSFDDAGGQGLRPAMNVYDGIPRIKAPEDVCHRLRGSPVPNSLNQRTDSLRIVANRALIGTDHPDPTLEQAGLNRTNRRQKGHTVSAACETDGARQRDGGVPAFDMSKITHHDDIEHGKTGCEHEGQSLRTLHYLDQLPDDETPVFVGRVPFERRFVGRCGE